MIVNVMMVFAGAASDDDSAAKEKREAPMAEPSTDYTPPRLEAPYATYSPLVANENAPRAAYYQATTFNGGPTTPSAAPAYEYNRYVGVIPLPPGDGNELGNGLKPGPPYNNAPYGLTPPGFNGDAGRNLYDNNNNNNNGYGRSNNHNNNGNGFNGQYDTFAKYGGQNSQGQYATSYAQLNGLGPSLTVYGENGQGNKNNNNPGSYTGQTSLDIKSPYNSPSPFSNSPNSYNSPGSFNNPSPFNGASGPSNFDGSFYGNPLSDAKYPSAGALVSNEPQYGPGGKGFNPPQPLNTQALKNSRPAALIPPHLQRKPASFLNEQKNPNFRPSFLLGSSVLSSTPDYNQPTLTSLGELNPFLTQPQNIQLIPNDQYGPAINMGSLPLAQRDYLPVAPQPQFLSGYQPIDNFGGQIQQQQTPVTSYGEALPDTIIYTKSSLYSERYGQHGSPT